MMILKFLVTVFFGLALALVVWSRYRNPIYSRIAEMGSAVIIISVYFIGMGFLWGIIKFS